MSITANQSWKRVNYLLVQGALGNTIDMPISTMDSTSMSLDTNKPFVMTGVMNDKNWV